MICTVPRRLAALAAALALSACAATEGQQNLVQRAFTPPSDGPGALRLTEVAPERRVELAREGQLQTPLQLPPEFTGAPAPAEHDPDGMRVSASALAAAGANIAPDVRVWVEQGGQARLDYGPRPQRATDLALSPGVLVRPF